MILELSDVLAIAGMLTPLYVTGGIFILRVVQLEQYCKDRTGYCRGGEEDP